MKFTCFSLLLCLTLSLSASELTNNFQTGKPEIKSINALDFGPEGLLFIGDSKSARVFVIETEDVEPRDLEDNLRLPSFDQKVADALGTSKEQITIEDLAVNPISKNIYLAVGHTNGNYLILKLSGEELSVLDLANISYDEVSIQDPIDENAEDRRGRPMRKWAISDLNFSNGKIYLTGLSNQEFGSTFRAIPFPFQKKEQTMSSLEIYHAAHGQFETHAPVKTFTSTNLNGEECIIASYTCTPLVVFPASDFKAGQHVKGRTVAELGNWNTPLDMIVMEKDQESYLLMANSNRALMKFKLSDIADYQGSITEPVEERGGTKGVSFIALPFVNVLQLDQLDEERFVMLQRNADGDLVLWSSGNRWL